MCLIKFSFILITPSLHIGDPSFSMNRNMKNRSAYNQFTSYWQLLSKFWCSPHIGDYFQNFTIFKILIFTSYWRLFSKFYHFQNFKILILTSYWRPGQTASSSFYTLELFVSQSSLAFSSRACDWFCFLYFVFCNSYFVFCILFFELIVTQ